MTAFRSSFLALATTLLFLSRVSSQVSSQSSPHYHHFHHRRQLPGNWTSQGCYTDNVGGRTLNGATYTDNNGMTTESCISFCSNQNFIYAGTEYGSQCYCDNYYEAGGAPTAASDCDFPCTGNAAETCGAGNRLNVYWSGIPPPPLPAAPSTIGGWVSLNCYSDNVNGVRSLGITIAANNQMTNEACTTACLNAGYPLAGTEYSSQCFCGDTIVSGAPISSSSCNMLCAGNNTEFCGGPNALNVYNYTGANLPAAPAAPSNIGNWVSLNCYSDNVNGVRSLGFGAAANDQMTNEACTTACFNAGYPLSGTEYSEQCYCGNTIVNGAPISSSSCNMACAGNSSEICGGPNALNVYNYTGTNLPTSGGGGGGDGGGGGGGGGGPTGVYPVLSGLPGSWAYNACWVDNAFGRAMLFQQPDNQNMTVEICVEACNSQNYTLAGLEYGVQCFCDNDMVNGAVVGDSSTCAMGCGGNSTEACGGPNRLSVYSANQTVTALPVPTPLQTNLPGEWQYQGCLMEVVNGRALPYQIIWPSNNTALACMNQCAAFGFAASGTEYGQECYCGDPSDIVASGVSFAPDSDCNFACPGDPTSICGAGNRITLYYWNGTMHVWNTPENTGYYEYFMPGVVVPLIATVTIINKVVLLEKTGTGFPNSTGGYELDLSLIGNFDEAYRSMHPKTDVFCSASLVLPDKGARHINVGGWSLESTFGIRFYTPDGAPGVNGTNDWEENVDVIALQRGRWYPSAAMLANGSIFVLGGETGSNAPAEPTMELLPKAPGGDTTIYFDWLANTDPYNLYPFVFVLPSMNLFVAYWNQARILEPQSFTTVATLPDIPGAVNDFQAGRTYPLEGSAMIFPQHAPYTDPLTVIICGGSTIGAGIALDTCVTIQPEVTNATWTLERMPSKRVLSCMVNLPDGTFLIANGAYQGVAGFGLATDPNLSAVLYDPSQPLGQRMSILNDTTIARLYHSELSLLPDGRVLVSGSDPQTYDADGNEIYPEEFRLEVYVPPYLTQGFLQPEFNLTENDWAYGGQYTITNVSLYQGTVSTLRISLLSATSSTHGNTMGARTLFPEFTCTSDGTSCTITAPPNAGISPPAWHQLFILDGPTPSYSQWVRIGGDPGGLGEWPDAPGFTNPGS